MRRGISSVFARVVGTAAANRARFPRWVNMLIDRVVESPSAFAGRLASRLMGGFTDADIPVLPPVPQAGTRLYVGPANYAGQGQLWARAAERHLPDVAALNMAFTMADGFNFPADLGVPVAVYMASPRWQEDQRDYVQQFTHVLVEAERPLFGRMDGGNAFQQARALREQGLGVAMICHGSDIRLPSRHQRSNHWSPFSERAMNTYTLERLAARNRAGLDELGAPVFVSTPDLLDDVPYATWCPVVVDPERWFSAQDVLERERPLVVHVPSKSVVKGTNLIAPALQRLVARGLVDYEYVEGVDSHDMPALYGRADIVLDQFRIGSYGVAACEAMAAGRVVIGQVTASVRDAVQTASGFELPIVEANPDTICAVLEDVIAHRDRYRALGARGPAFVRAVHDGRHSARVLGTFLGTKPVR